MSGFSRSHQETRCLTQEERKQLLEEACAALRKKVAERGDLPHATVKRQLEIIEQLSSFELGRSLLVEKLINVFWTDYIILCADKSQNLGHLSALENFIVTQAPFALAAQQRFAHFQNTMQSLVKNGVCMGSIPCGMMRELLTLDFKGIDEFTLMGVDINDAMLELALKLANETGVASNLFLLQKNAWDVDISNSFDALASNGLTLHVTSDENVVKLFEVFFRALKAGGVFVTSAVTFPPGYPTLSEWQLGKLSQEALQLQRIIFVDILDAKWQAYRSTEQMLALLKKAGFTECDVLYDDAHLFPSFVARKR